MDINEIHKWHNLFFPNGEIFEVRLLGGNAKNAAVSGYFKDVDLMISKLQPLVENDTQRNNFQVYFALNELPEALYNREQHDKFVWGALTTKDNDISRRKWVFIDFDSKRPKGVSANAGEVSAAKKKLGQVYKFLKGEGFKEPVMAFSGNGYHMHLRVDMPNDNEHKDLVKTFIDIISSRFSDGNVEIDKAVFNAARICKLYGTEARKGLNTPARPWRMSKIEYIPSQIELNEDALFKAFVEKYSPKRETRQVHDNYGGYGRFDLERWLGDHGIEYRYAGVEGGMTKYQLRHCGWEDAHSESHEWTDAAIFVMPDGKIIYKCFHDHCQGRTWPEFRKLHEPDYDPNKKDRYWSNNPTVIIQQQAKPKPLPDIKPEDEKKGRKWLRPIDVKKVDLYNLPKVKTGFLELDRYIKGLHFFEYTIVSGINGSGKSSWLNTLILNILNEGTKVALWSGELPVTSLLTWIDLAAAGSNHLRTGYDKEGDPYYYVSDDMSQKIRKWYGDNFLVFNDAYGNKWEQLFNDIKELLPLGFRMFILDNLSAMDIDIIDGDKNKREKTVVEELHKFCINNQCHIILVVHPRKGTARGQRSMLRKEDIAGSGAITDLADNVFIIHRNNEDFRKGMAEFYGKDEAAKYEYGNEYGEVGNVIEICKNRMFGNQDHTVRFYFDRMSRRFKNTPDENIEYGWNVDANAKQGDLNLNDEKEDNKVLPFGQATDEAPF